MIPPKENNPDGYHLKYNVTKADGRPVDPNAEYFVLRLDEGGDPVHVEACRVAILHYADCITPHIPDLANDLYDKYHTELTNEQQMLAECYGDDMSIYDLSSLIGSQKELDRLNAHRGTEWTQQMLDDVLRTALRMRLQCGQS